MGLFDDLIPAQAQPRTIPPVGRALLDTIAGSESPGYDVMYGGGRFDDFTDHPRRPVPITSGPNAGRNSTAAGRYQFLARTWDEVKNEAGLKDFSPESQDIGAWHLADKTYKTKTGRDLATDLENAKGNPNAVAGIGRYLSGVWTSLPGGIEPNRATMSFADRFDRAQPTDLSSQSRRPAGLFDDLLPAASPDLPTSPPVSDALPDTGGRFTDAPGQSFRTAREGVSPAVATKGEAAKGGFFRGATFNFIDELKALAESGGVDPNDPDGLTAAIGLIKGAYRKATGDPEADAAYRAAVSRERETSERQQEQQPGASLAGEVGGVAATLPFMAGRAVAGAGLGARTLQGARVGAATGGLAGVGAGTDLESRATGGATGAAIGGMVGAAIPAVVEGVVRGTRGLATPIANAVRGVRDPESEAARRVTLGLQRDIAADPQAAARLTPQEFTASVQGGGPATLMDLGGETTRALARSAANTSPEGRQILNQTINDRFEGQTGRVTGWLNNTFNFPNAAAQQEAIEQTARGVNRGAYARAYRDGDQQIWSPELERLVSSPDVTEAMRAAAQRGRSRAVTEGYGGFNPGVTVENGMVNFRRGPTGQPTYPNLQFWDYTKREIDDAARAANRAGRSDEARVLTQLATQLRTELDRAVPSYAQARAGAARFFGAENALEAGQNFVMQNFAAPEVRRSLARMSPTERQLFQDGFVSRYIETLERVGDRRSVLNQVAANPAAREKLNIALGPQRAAELETGLRAEGIMDFARTAVQGNSTTARQLTELGLAGGTYGLGTGFDVMNPNPSALMSAALVYGAARGRTRINENVSRRVAEMLTSNDPRRIAQGVRIVSRNQNMLNSLRSFDQSLARVSAQQAPTPAVPALQSMGTGRAEEDQPRVPGP